MTESVDRQTAVLRLRGADDILILCHKNPDGDTIGCAGALYLALKALGKNAAILCSDPIPKMYDYMELRWFDGSFNPAFVVAVDVASIQLFGENNNVPQYAAHTNLCIDHHASNSGYAYETLLDPGAAIPRVRVNVRFVIEPDGTMTGIRVSAPKEHSGFAKLVRMAVDKTPLWTPAVAGGEKVRFRISQILLFGQEEELGKNPDSLDVLPKFQNGGLPEFRRWVMETVKFPREALESGVEGRVLASFVVEADGSVGAVRIIRSPHPVLSREVVQALAESPRWTPGSQNGEPVRVKYTVPVDFRIPAERKTASGPAQERNTTRR